jgi:shikimate kinase
VVDAPVVPADRHLVLIGMMGAGKSTVGRLLARRLGRPLVDSDAVVEARTGSTVRELWEREGEAGYRLLETDALLDALAAPEPAVIAAAGGVVLAEANRVALAGDRAEVVWLRAGVEVLVDRATRAGGTHRPLLDGDPAAKLTALYRARESCMPRWPTS